MRFCPINILPSTFPDGRWTALKETKVHVACEGVRAPGQWDLGGSCRVPAPQVAYTGSEGGIGRMGEGDRMVRDLAAGGHAAIDRALAASDIRIFGDGAGNGTVSSGAVVEGEGDLDEADEGGEELSEDGEEEEEGDDGDQEASTSEGAGRSLRAVP